MITSYAENPGEKLWFHSIVTKLYHKARVPMKDKADRFMGKKALDNGAVRTMKKMNIKGAPTLGPTRSAVASSSRSLEEKVIVKQH